MRLPALRVANLDEERKEDVREREALRRVGVEFEEAKGYAAELVALIDAELAAN